MFYYVYILESIKNNSLYTGYCSDLRKRFKEHNQGRSFSTKKYRPWKLIHYEAYSSKDDAERRELYFKTSQGMKMLKRLLKSYFYQSVVEKKPNLY